MLLYAGCVVTVVWSLILPLQPQAPAPQSEARVSSPPTALGFLYKTIRIEDETYAYSVYVPPGYTSERAWPMVLFLHGSGERGEDGFKQTEVGLPKAIRNNFELVPAIVVMPQCRPGRSWTGDMAEMALRCAEQTSREYHLDPQRIYLTGLSLGGAGTWTIAAAIPGRFAAIAPICGFGDVQQAGRLARVPVWCVHGDQDDRVPVERSREMVKAIQSAGGDVTYHELRGQGHFVWDVTYNDPKFWRWLFSQRLANPPEDRTRQAPETGSGH